MIFILLFTHLMYPTTSIQKYKDGKLYIWVGENNALLLLYFLDLLAALYCNNLGIDYY